MRGTLILDIYASRKHLSCELYGSLIIYTFKKFNEQNYLTNPKFMKTSKINRYIA